ncbi:hypothetical protein cand_026330 [Cryptosporidium andersoni]|uniref:EKC/KEOPS complex subunit CGI121 n=1 Tax=Cryptosporidium andersoni TaxID=117008 RepID=A0A1J4MAH0_9CRYT|nr:hypothetical protein cand_026330 [Cryptosporidium andersoni]
MSYFNKDLIKKYTLGNLLPNYSISMALICDVKNTNDIIDWIFNKHTKARNTFNEQDKLCVFVNARMVYSVEHMLHSIMCSMLRQKLRHKTKTKSIETDILYYLSTSTKITNALNTFGISEYVDSILVTCINMSEAEICDCTSNIKGNIVDIDQLSKVHNIKDIYKMINYSNVKQSSKLDPIDIFIQNIAIKDI